MSHVTIFQALNEMLLQLESISLRRCSPDQIHSSQSAAVHTMLLIHQGKGLLRIRDDTHQALPGSVFFIARGQKLEVAVNEDQMLEYYMLTFVVMIPHKINDNWSVYRKDSGSFPIEGTVPISNPAQITQLVQQMHQITEGTGGEREYFQQKHLFYELLYILANEFDTQGDHPQQGIERTLDYLKENYMKPISLESLAHMSGFSSSYYSRLFKKSRGIGVKEYITSLRINRAKELLILSHLSLQNIAQSVGYNEESYFSRMFKKETGYSPAAYSKKYRQKIVVTRYTYNGDLLALGVIPYASVLTEGRIGGPHLNKHMMDSVPLHMYTKGKWNELIDLQPHLIVSDSPELSAIAPTVVLPYWKLEWRERFNKIALALGKEKEASRWLEQYDYKAAQAGQRIRGQIGEGTVTVLRIVGGKLCVYGIGRNIGSVLYHDLKLEPPHAVSQIHWRKTISTQELPNFDGDYILLMTSPRKKDTRLYRKLMDSPEWRELTAVRKQRWFQLDSYYPWLDYSALSHEMMLEETVRLFVP